MLVRFVTRAAHAVLQWGSPFVTTRKEPLTQLQHRYLIIAIIIISGCHHIMSDTPVPPILEWFAEWKVQGQLKLSRLAKKVAAIPSVQTVAEQVCQVNCSAPTGFTRFSSIMHHCTTITT